MTAIDPVCGMEVEESTARWKNTYQGQTFYFCAPGCLGSFQQEPAKYAAAGSSAGQPQQPPSHEPDHGRMAGDHS